MELWSDQVIVLVMNRHPTRRRLFCKLASFVALLAVVAGVEEEGWEERWSK